ncbi:hypothetical protein FB45DRAFT_898781 [Roridomyces roridus]|uniref:Uncharacterized protein n=1 Tax=Roridomyces roridus TaxID=1738132 RepID=A0AAD7CEH6_9AGAR|nr:hypothetical protein FB45DRAFT_898781 [Roridomyces roridus]
MSDLLDVGAFRAQLMASSSSAPVSGLGRPSVPLFINPTLPAPKFHAPSYLLHGVPFNALPDESQQFLTRYGLTVQLVRQSLTDALFDTVLELTEDIVRAHVLSDVDTLDSHLRTLAYWVSRYIMLADALCWVDITARDGSPHALSVEQADHYRALQITEPVRMVRWRTMLYYGWRIEFVTKALEDMLAPTSFESNPSSPPVTPPALPRRNQALAVSRRSKALCHFHGSIRT